jgi:predicted aldo/keto reductase-like oxidoreductase
MCTIFEMDGGNEMNRRFVGKTGIAVSEIGLGCEHLQGLPKEQVKAVCEAALSSGINIFDVFMSEPNVRDFIGEAIKGHREKVCIQGHIGAAWKDDQYARTTDAKDCRIFFEDLLSRLQTDYIDFGMLHFVDTEEDYKKVFESDMIQYALQLKAEGKIKALGMSSHNPVTAKRAVETGLLDLIMFSINPAFDLLPEVAIDDLFTFKTFTENRFKGIDPSREQLYRTCEKMGVGITVMKTLAAGMLFSEKMSLFGAPLNEYQCIHYALDRPAVASALIGCKTPEEVFKAVQYETVSDREKEYSVALGKAGVYSAQGKCMYCNHCLPCPKHIDIAAVNRYLDLSTSGTVSPTIQAHYNALDAHGSDCIACGACEKRCPFQVKVSERMREAATVFGK